MSDVRIAIAILALSLAACGGSQSTSEVEAGVQSYLIGGVIAQLPDGPGIEFMIRHEAIPHFVSVGGDTVGMHSMTMGFPVAGDVSLESFAVGDSVQFRFEVRWGGSPPLQVVSIEKR
jgi:Copper binding periplasmic protein CusF